jgi:1-acyl-sn-glycerol-3-phosphate acyltransferase
MKRSRSLSTVRPGSRSGRAGGAGADRSRPVLVPRHDLFRERLRALESQVEAAVAESGAGSTAQGRMGRLTDAFELLLDGYAQLARSAEGSSLRDVLTALPLARRIPEVDDFGYDRDFEDFVGPLFRLLYRHWWRVDAAGIENVPGEGRVMLVANHAGGMFAYDGAMLKVALLDEHPAHRRARPLVDDFVYNLPYVGTFMTRCGGVRASSENAERLLERDELIEVFPEGTRGIGKPYSDRYHLLRFGRGGFIRVALRTRTPIVPVAIVGSEEIHPILGRWNWLARQIGLPYFPLTPTFPWLGLLGLIPLPSKWRIEFGRPLDWRAQHGPEAASDRLLVSRLTEEVRRRVQDLLATALERRGPAFF